MKYMLYAWQFFIRRSPRLFNLLRLKGISNGWWLWKIENNLILDINGEFLQNTAWAMKKSATHARWNGMEEEADGILEFIENMKKFREEFHDPVTL